MLSPLKNRWWVVVGAILIQFSLGSIYAWSVFTPKLVEAGWSTSETQHVFRAGLAFFAIVMVLAGRLMPKIGPRTLAIIGGVVLGSGYFLAGLLGETSFWAIFFLVGVVGGTGIGLGYVVPIAVGMRWFPDKKGLVAGLAVAGFGFGSMLWVKLAGTWCDLLTRLGLGTTFMVYGVLFLITVVLGGCWMVFPPADWKPEGWSEANSAASGSSSSMPPMKEVAINSLEMLRTPQFYMIFLTMMIGTGAGLMTIGVMKLFPMQALEANGFSALQATAISGTAMAVFFSIANGFGRIAWGAISDKVGRKRAILIMCGTQGLFVIAFQWMAGTPALLYLGALLIGFNFGGNFALFPAITADTFGAKFIGQNYGWVFLSYGFGGNFGPWLAGRLGDMGNFPLAFTLCGILCLVATGIIAMVKPPQSKELAKAA